MEKRTVQKLGSLVGLMLFGFIIFLGFYHFSQQFKLISVRDDYVELAREASR